MIAYSDNHLGSLLAYSLFRILGANRETAFQLWAITIFLLNYFVTYAVVRRQKFGQIGAIACAYLFTFSMIMAAQMSHIQLAPRFMVPVAFWMSTRFLETGSAKHLCLLLAACAFQVYLGIYIGYFLLLLLIPFLALIFLLKHRWTAIRFFSIRAGIPGLLRRGLAYAGSGLAFVVVLLPIAVPYYQAQQEIGGRNWEELVPLLPRWQSYLYAPESILWGRILRFGEVLPMAHEHALFFGFLPLVGIFLFVFLIWKKEREIHWIRSGNRDVGCATCAGSLNLLFHRVFVLSLCMGLPARSGRYSWCDPHRIGTRLFRSICFRGRLLLT